MKSHIAATVAGLALVGPMQLDATDKRSAKQLHRNVESVMAGPKHRILT